MTQGDSGRDISVRPLREDDIAAADHIMRLAFGTFLGIPEPASFMGDASYVPTRWRSNPAAAFGAEAAGRLVGSNFATHWGSVGFFGPLTVHPDSWERGIGKLLMEPIMDCFDRWGTRHAGLFTFAHSEKHVGLYQRFGFWPHYLTAIMGKPIDSTLGSAHWTTYAGTPDDERETALAACRELAGEIFDGLDLSDEIEAVENQKLGETVLSWDDGLAGFAVCHCGPGTEAGSNACYIKFAAARPGGTAAERFGQLLNACETMASQRGLSQLIAGANTGRHESYRLMLERGFRTGMQGVAMHRPNQLGYSRPDVYAIDDWR